MQTVQSQDITYDKLSVVDPGMRVFHWQGQLLRGVYPHAVDSVRKLFDSGLIEELVARQLIPDTWITDLVLDEFPLVVGQKRIRAVTYPHEWSYSMVKSAALLALEVNAVANEFGYQLSDCHGLNVVFDGMRPVYVDLGSFVACARSAGRKVTWIAYEEFLRAFEYPLDVWRRGMEHIAHCLLLCSTPFISHREYQKISHPWLWFVPDGLLDKLNEVKFARHRLSAVSDSRDALRPASRIKQLALRIARLPSYPKPWTNMNRLMARVSSMERKPRETKWTHYHDRYQSANGNLVSTPRFERIAQLITDLGISSVIELAGNQGVLSRLLLKVGVREVICTDYDESAIEQFYRTARGADRNISAAVFDFMLASSNPTAISVSQRLGSDAALALAVTHHLVLGQRFPIDLVLSTIGGYAKRYVFIEFMPLGLFDGKFAPPLPPWYSLEWFRSRFREQFALLHEEELDLNRVLFVGEHRAQKTSQAHDQSPSE